MRRRVWALGPSASPLFPAGAGGGEGGATGVRTEGRGPARAPPPPPRRRLGAGPPSPPPLPTLRPVAPGARAHTHASPGSMQMRYPEAGGPGGGGGGRGWSRVRVPERAPGTCSLLLRSLLRAPTSRPAKRSGLVSADPLLAAPAATVPAPLIGHRTLRARPACGLGHSGLTSRRPTGLWVGEGRGITHFLGMFQKFSYLSGPQHGANLAILEKLPPPPRVDLMLCAYEKGVQGLGL